MQQMAELESQVSWARLPREQATARCQHSSIKCLETAAQVSARALQEASSTAAAFFRTSRTDLSELGSELAATTVFFRPLCHLGPVSTPPSRRFLKLSRAWASATSRKLSTTWS